eukprot:s2664_g6.t1
MLVVVVEVVVVVDVRFVMDKLKTFYGSKQSLLQEGAEPVLADTKPIRRKDCRSEAVKEPGKTGRARATAKYHAKAAAAISDTPASTTEAALPTSVAEEEGEVSLDERAAQAVAALQVTALVPPPPAPKQHAPSISSGTSIIRVLELCESELAKNLAQLDTQAGDEETEQRELLKQSMILQKQKDLDVERNTREVKAADNEVRRLQADLEAAKNELEPLEETLSFQGYYEQVKQRCAKKVTREDIMKKRQREIEGLKEALAVLEGETGLVQLRTQRVTSPRTQRNVGGASETMHALLLDCDGVIADSESLHREAYNEVFEEFGLLVRWSEEYYDYLQNKIGGGKPKMRLYFNENGWPPSAGDDAESHEKLIDDLQDRKTEIYRGYVTSGKASARPGILQLIQEGLKREDLKMAICSAGTKEAAQQVLSAVVGDSLLKDFDLILLGDDVSRKKPDPLIYQLASERLKVPAERCTVVEDSKIGLEAARARTISRLLSQEDLELRPRECDASSHTPTPRKAKISPEPPTCSPMPRHFNCRSFSHHSCGTSEVGTGRCTLSEAAQRQRPRPEPAQPPFPRALHCQA